MTSALAQARWLRRTFVAMVAVAFLAPLGTRDEAHAGPQGWTRSGPEGATVQAMAVDPNNASTVFLATTGGVYRSTDAGVTWTLMGLGHLTIYDLAVDPAVSGTLFVATNGGVYQSTDAGATWTFRNVGGSNNYPDTIEIAPTTPRTVYGATDTRLLKSADGGVTWTVTTATPVPTGHRARDLVVRPGEPNTLLALHSNGISRSTDAGATWTQVSSGESAYSAAFAPSNNTIAYAGIWPTISKSVDGGVTWVPLTVGFNGGTGVNGLAVAATDPLIVYSASSKGIFRSLNGGATWSARNTGLVYPAATEVAIDPADPSRLYAGLWGGLGVHRSTDASASWTQSNTGLWNTHAGDVEADPGDPSTAYAISFSPPILHKTTNGGASWSKIWSDLSSSQAFYDLAIDPANASRMWLASTGGVYRSTNGGTSWTLLTGTPSMSRLVVDPLTTSTLYGVGSGTVRKSTDSGATWTVTSSGITGFVSALAIHPTTPSTLYATVGTGVYKSVDSGASWTASSSGLPANPGPWAILVDPTTPDIVYLAVSASPNPPIYRSTDGGASWSASSDGILGTWSGELEADPAHPGRIYTLINADPWVSDDSGGSWARVSDGTGSVYISSLDVASQGGRVYAATNSAGVLELTVEVDAPTNPSVTTSHQVGGWSSNSTIQAFLSGAADAGSGLDGYSYVWDTNPSTIPDKWRDAAATTTSLSRSATNGTWYLHLRTGDRMGNWSAPVHIGPMGVDNGSPSMGALTTSHPVGSWSNDPTVEVSWTATDGVSGIDGFSVMWDQSPFTAPDMTMDQEETATGSISAPLSGSGHYVHVRAKDNAGNWSGAVHLGPFWIDTGAPSNPTSLQSTSHTQGVWSSNGTIAVSWNGASDPSGISGYSYAWDTSATSEPDTVSETSGITANASVADGGSHYFHLRTRDGAGNWSAPLHLGPFRVDTAAPVTSLATSTHTIGTWSNDRTVDVSFQDLSDGSGSGIDGFSYQWDSSPTTTPDQAMDVQEIAAGITSPSLTDGSGHYVHVRVKDNAGNWSDAMHLGPFWIDGSSPSSVSASSASHAPEAWSANPTVEVDWSAADEGSGVTGYSWEWSTSATTIPDETSEGTSTSATSDDLPSGGSHYFHVRARDAAGNWTETRHVGPFRIDVTAPGGEPVATPSAGWTNDTTIDIDLTGITDEHTSVAGVSFLWDSTATTTPDDELEAGPASSPELGAGDSWFHLWAKDALGNWSATTHLGPFRIDTSTPTAPTLSSSSHTVSLPSSDTTIDVEWSGASDDGSGVAGYSYGWSDAHGTVPDTLASVGAAVESATSEPQGDGEVWFHLRVLDAAGNWTDAAPLGPFVIDGVFTSDGLIRKGTSPLVGDGIYNTTATGQSVLVRARRGQTKTFTVQVQNDDTSLADSFLVQGPGSNTRFVVTYFAGTTNITPQVKAGTYPIGDVAPGGSVELTIKIKPRSSARVGSIKAVLVKIYSDGEPAVQDAVKARVQVRRG